MSAVAHPSTLNGPRNGGVAARRAVTRWARRMFRREWRQQLLVVTLLTVAVAAAIGSITLVHNTDAATNSEFGSANTVLEFDGTDTRKLEAGLATAKKSFGTTDVIGHRSVAVPGSVDKVDFRAQDPNGAYGGELLALHRGRYPDGRGEVAVTDGVAKLLGLDLGSTLALGGTRWTVVGIVENPRKLSDEFALVSPSFASPPDHVSVLVDANDASILSFFHSIDQDRSGFAGMMRIGNDGPSNTLAMFSVATVFLLLASLIAAAGFAVIAQRRLRHLGMLAAIGATQKHVRLVLIANGAIVGTIAALCGTVVGLALWVVFAPTLESAVDHRVDRLSLPWLLIALTVLLAVFGAIAAAWWPGRTVARLPVTLALSGRPPKPRPARHSAIAAAALIAIGIGCLALSNRDNPGRCSSSPGSWRRSSAACSLGPLAIRVFSGLAGRVSIAPRLALRDLVRYQARSGAALAAITLALGIAATVVIIASAEAAKRSGRTGQPVRPADAGLPRTDGRSGPHPRGRTRAARPPDRSRPTTRRRTRRGNRHPASQSRPTRRNCIRPRQHSSLSDGRASETSRHCRGAKAIPRRIGALRRHAGGSQLPRNRSWRGRFRHGLPRRSQRSGRCVLHTEREEAGGDGARRHERREDRRGAPLVRLRERANAAGVHHPQRSPPPRLEADPGRLARRVEPASDERPDRGRAHRRGGSWSRSRRPARKALLRQDDGHRDRRWRPPRARHPRDDRRADPQRERR